jgi:hypothetical protein
MTVVLLPLIDVGFTDHQTALLEGTNRLNKAPEHINCLEYLSPSSKFSASCGNLLISAQKELLVLAVVSCSRKSKCIEHNACAALKSLSLSLTTKVVMLVHIKL